MWKTTVLQTACRVYRQREVIDSSVYVLLQFTALPVSYTHLDVYKRQVQDMLTEGIIEPSSSAWFSLVVLTFIVGLSLT